MKEPDKCYYCHQKPQVIDMGAIFYVQCACGKWNRYEFCGASRHNAIVQWNVTQSDGRRFMRGGDQ